MSIKDEYITLRNYIKERILIIKHGNFYYCVLDDSIIIHYLFNFKYRDDSYKCICFSSSALTKVINKLNYLKITYMVIENENKILKLGIFDNYDLYLKEAKIYEKKEDIINTVNIKIKYFNIDELNRLLILIRAIKEE